jgi:hypothetical protein
MWFAFCVYMIILLVTLGPFEQIDASRTGHCKRTISPKSIIHIKQVGHRDSVFPFSGQLFQTQRVRIPACRQWLPF